MTVRHKIAHSSASSCDPKMNAELISIVRQGLVKNTY